MEVDERARHHAPVVDALHERAPAPREPPRELGLAAQRDGAAAPGLRLDREIGAAPVVEHRRGEGEQDQGALALELDVGADKLRLLGRIEPPGRAAVVLAWPEGRWDGESGDDGTFRVDELPRRPFCVVVDGARPVKSGWVVP